MVDVNTIQQGYAPKLERQLAAPGEFVWLASSHLFPGVLAQGDTAEEAEANWQINVADRLKDMMEDGLPIPPCNKFVLTAVAQDIKFHSLEHLKGNAVMA